MSTPQMPWELNLAKTALLVIDMQNDFVREGAPMEVPMAREYLPNMQSIVAQCRTAGIPVIYSQHVLHESWDISPLETAYNPALKQSGLRLGTPGAEVVDELKPLAHDYIILKHRYDAFHNTQLDNVLATVRGLRQIDTVIVIGTVTNICCESTARSAFMRDYKVVMVSDANGGLDQTSQEATLAIIERVFGRVMSTDQLLQELAQ
ncbi:isochorismatase family protein [Paenalcaligenes hominis]|uniref:isochorismatase family protein n=1 Tax=Paenalcaligenes hominis TaxID=643674 RepID=UPI0035251FC3